MPKPDKAADEIERQLREDRKRLKDLDQGADRLEQEAIPPVPPHPDWEGGVI